MRHGLKEELKATKCEEAVHIGEPKQGEIHGEDDNVGGYSRFGTSNEARKPYAFPNGLFMVVGVIDDEQTFKFVIMREENRGEQSPFFFLSIEEEKYLNWMLIRNDEPKEETTFSLHTNFVRSGAT